MGCLDTRAGKRYINQSESQDVKILTQDVRKPEDSIAGKEQRALARIMPLSDASHLVITFADTTVHFSIHVCLTVCGTTTGRPRSAPAALMVATCLESQILTIRSEALEARSNEALS
jgi:hypothetical protein